MKTKAIISLVFGICGIVFPFIPFLGVITVVLSIVGIILSAIALKSRDMSCRGIAIGGLVCSIVGFLFSVLGSCICTGPVVTACVAYISGAQSIVK